jgi:hypothetical protein
MIQFLRRLFIGLWLAILMGLLAGIAVAGAQPPDPQGDPEDCLGCHNIIRANWEDSAHGLAGIDPEFIRVWNERGQPADCMACHATGYDEITGDWDTEGIECIVCHSPVPEDHPEQVIPTNISSRLCGTCHLDTFAEWEISTHGQEGLTCNRCHNSHTTSLKASGVQELCEACHNEQTHFFTYTPHYEQGILCTDCHLKVEEGEMGEGHGERRHTFTVDLDTCTECHGEGLHYPGTPEEKEDGSPLRSGLTFPADDEPLTQQPNPVSPIGFAVLAAIVGMAAGMLLAPWLERWYRRANRTDV